MTLCKEDPQDSCTKTTTNAAKKFRTTTSQPAFLSVDAVFLLFLLKTWLITYYWHTPTDSPNTFPKGFQICCLFRPNRIQQRDRDKSRLLSSTFSFDQIQSSQKEHKTECSITRRRVSSVSARRRKMMLIFSSDTNQPAAVPGQACLTLFFFFTEEKKQGGGWTWPFHKIRLLACTADHHQDKEEDCRARDSSYPKCVQ